MSRRPTLALVAFAALASTALLAFARPEPIPAPAAAWEYRIVRGAGIDLGALPKAQDEQMAAAQALLNQLGAEGWELQVVQGPFAVLRRPR
jgi:hypothetical protein